MTEIWRHPIKGHGRESVAGFDIAASGTLPGDRVWAVAHEASRLDGGTWVRCANFMRGAKTPALMAITAETGSDTVTLRHPDRPDLTFDPDGDGRPFLDWIAPLVDPTRTAPVGIVRATGRGFTDSDFPSLSLNNLASHAAVEAAAGKTLSRDRWRGNLWIADAAPWAEFDWIGRDLTVGGARFHVETPITRCRATMANPDTGHIDTDTLGILESRWGHRDFGVYLRCIEGGPVARGDALVLQ
nr:MOSC N-terminal beta barrel domain-containing protein [Jannaschia sp. S6380]